MLDRGMQETEAGAERVPFSQVFCLLSFSQHQIPDSSLDVTPMEEKGSDVDVHRMFQTHTLKLTLICC